MRTYGKLCTLIYDLDKPFALKNELDLYTNEITKTDVTILEPMCGSGRFYIPLLKNGYDITGFDLSEDMLNACNKKCLQLDLKPNIYNADITNFDTSKKYDYVFIPIGSISLLISEQTVLESFKNIYNSLKVGGKYIFSFLNTKVEEKDIPDWQESMQYKSDGMDIICKQKLKYKKGIGLLDMKLLYELKKGDELIEEEYQDFPMKLYKEEVIEKYLRELGFSKIKILNMNEQENVFSVISCQK
jgi:SAM-dependent methyltransferase